MQAVLSCRIDIFTTWKGRIDWACSQRRRTEKYVQNIARKPQRERTAWGT
jgi:hypothetical protein